VQVVRVAWVGTRTEQFTETNHFFREVLGLASVQQGTDFAILQLPSGDRDYLEIFGTDAEGKEFEAHGDGAWRSGPPGTILTCGGVRLHSCWIADPEGTTLTP